jgi:hypothetical protein
MAQPVTSTAAAQALQSTLEAAQLNIPNAAKLYEQQLKDEDSDLADEGNDLHDPAVVAADVAAHIVRIFSISRLSVAGCIYAGYSRFSAN